MLYIGINQIRQILINVLSAMYKQAILMPFLKLIQKWSNQLYLYNAFLVVRPLRCLIHPIHTLMAEATMQGTNCLSEGN